MAPVKVFGSAAFSNVARVLVCLEEVGAEYEIVDVDFHTKEHKCPGHLARNPFGQVPAFQDGELMLFQSRAISRYVLRKYTSTSATNLLGDDLHKSAAVDAWLDVEALEYEPPLHAVFVQHHVVPFILGGAPDEKVISRSVEKLRKVLEVYEAQLGKHRYLAGDAVSLADLSHFPYTHYFMAMPCTSILDAFPRVKAWWEDVLARPAVQKVAAIMDRHSG